ncbi:hypothetical protein D3C80_1747820 [compost metagenome]
MGYHVGRNIDSLFYRYRYRLVFYVGVIFVIVSTVGYRYGPAVVARLFDSVIVVDRVVVA